MHTYITTHAGLARAAPQNWFAITKGELERLAAHLLGRISVGSWVRSGEQFAVVANRKLGALAPKLLVELQALCDITNHTLAESSPDAPLRATAFFHMRFENIHPLLEGNGRVGRVILAAQLQQTLRIPMEEVLEQVYACEPDYKAAFQGSTDAICFELMLDLIARITGRVVAEEAIVLPAPLQPLYPDRRPLVRKSAQHVRPVRTPTQPQRPNPFGRFR